MFEHAPAQIITPPAQIITAPAQPPATGAVVYTALFVSGQGSAKKKKNQKETKEKKLIPCKSWLASGFNKKKNMHEENDVKKTGRARKIFDKGN